MAITLVWRTDVHLSDRTPRSRKDNWTDTILGKLRQVGEIAREVKADAVLVFTDGYVESQIDWRVTAPSLWLVTERESFTPPSGRLVRIKQ